jgi:hypothetical protein
LNGFNARVLASMIEVDTRAFCLLHALGLSSCR